MPVKSRGKTPPNWCASIGASLAPMRNDMTVPTFPKIASSVARSSWFVCWCANTSPKQSIVFRYVTRLMFHVPDATIHTFRELMEPGGTDKYRKHINKLEGTPRRFFETEFDSKEFTNTKTQVLRRLYGVLENQTFERMFTHPQSKFDMFTELNAGKLILINTSKSLLKEQGTQILGRFFIALIAQAAQERATLPDYERICICQDMLE